MLAPQNGDGSPLIHTSTITSMSSSQDGDGFPSSLLSTKKIYKFLSYLSWIPCHPHHSLDCQIHISFVRCLLHLLSQNGGLHVEIQCFFCHNRISLPFSISFPVLLWHTESASNFVIWVHSLCGTSLQCMIAWQWLRFHGLGNVLAWCH